MMTLLDTRTTPAPAGAAPGRRRSANTRGNSRIRVDIEGLRAIATLLVLPYHAGLMLFPGGFVGVDVFFVISGFVITGQLLKEVDRSGRISLLAFYARRAKRLLPASAVVLVATSVMLWLWVPRIRWETTGGDIVASALYFVNWRLADRSVDYLAEDVPPSAVQHFWSLAVEEQFYVFWPLLLIGADWLARRLRVRRDLTVLAGLALVAVPSLLWAVHQASANPERAYFVTTTRVWEFTVGAVVAVLATRAARLPRPVALALAWAGLALILLAARIYTAETTWPGAYALVPTVGTALFIAGGDAAGRFGPVSILKNGFMQFLGYLTYSLYLWHWPLLIVAREHFGGISVTTGLLIVVLCVVPAWLSFHLVENPIRNARSLSRSPRAALSLGLNFTLLGVAAGLALVVAVGATSTGVPANAQGAAVLSSAPTADRAGKPVDRVSGGITPDPVKAPEDVPGLYADGCQVSTTSSDPVSCSYGPKDAGTTIAVVGDSKAAQWVPALEILAREHDWRVVTYTKSACQFSAAEISLDGAPYASCTAWGRNVLDRLTTKDRPDLVLTAGQRDSGIVGESDGELDLSEDAMVTGLGDMWRRLTDSGSKVLVLADTPQTFQQVYACVSEHPDELTRCTYDRAKGIAGSGAPVQKRAAGALGAVDLTDGKAPRRDAGPLYYLDLVDWICPSSACPPVIGNVLIYRQGSHLTKTYVETLAPRLEKALLEAGLPA
ncbi:acyltransferase [Nocardioides guangzhouensis]|uniref:Acyltransferase n=1 Tax=Nocardioides guangzhouensis TaxID=2497878 RepID=A0A4Q4ZHS2_9ACTN|nr:acyltransferase family protein [Nocardioides guangzhouensis]RYP87782.1 acyltransferase [Nocardioides guangzhouensis]